MNTRLIIAVGLALSLAACDRFPGSAPEVVPTVVLNGANGPTATEATNAAAPDVNGGSASASGVIVPGQEARLASALAGRTAIRPKLCPRGRSGLAIPAARAGAPDR